jgi:hypothetical protein
MITKLSPTAQDVRLSDLNTQIGANAQMLLYAATIPFDPSVAPTGTLLATLYGANTVFGAVTNAVPGTANAYLTAGTITSGNAVANGTATMLRIANSSGGGVVDLDVGVTGANTSVTLPTVTITAGLTVGLETCVIND